MGIKIDPVLLFVGAWVAGYWNMTRAFGGKCNYLSNMYNDIIKEYGKDNHQVAKLLSLNFVSQLLTMDLWSHRLYSWVFISTLSEAAKWSIENTENYPYVSYEEFIEVANNGKLEVSIARNMVMDYQKFIKN